MPNECLSPFPKIVHGISSDMSLCSSKPCRMPIFKIFKYK